MDMVGLYKAMMGRLRQLSEPRLRKQAGIEKSQTPVERDILVQWVRKRYFLLYRMYCASTLKDKNSVWSSSLL